MMTKLKFAMFALALAGSAPALAHEDPIIGAWRMTSLQITDSQGKKTDVPYSGQVIFSQSVTLSVQAMDPDPAAKPTTYTANGYEAYYGPVAIDEEKAPSPSLLSRPWCAISSDRNWSGCSRSPEISW